MSIELILQIAKISSFSILLPLLAGLIRLKKLNREQQLVFVLVAVSAFFETLTMDSFEWIWEGLVGYNNNLPGLHLFTVIQFVLIILIYRRILMTLFGKYALAILIGGFMVFALANAVWLDGLLKMNPHARALQSLILLPLALYYLLDLLRTMKLNYLERDPLFWVSIAVILYFSGSLFIFLSTNLLLPEKETLMAVYTIHSILNIFANLLFAIALWVKPPARILS